MTTTENTRPGVWISVAAVGTDYVRISADIPDDRLAAASRALAAVVNTDAPKEGMPSGAAWERAVLADEDACRRVDDDAHAQSDKPAVEPAQAEAQLEAIVKLLRDIAEHTAPKIIRIGSARVTTADELKEIAEHATHGMWGIPSDVFSADSGDATADVDQDGPDCEGPEGGESA